RGCGRPAAAGPRSPSGGLGSRRACDGRAALRRLAGLLGHRPRRRAGGDVLVELLDLLDEPVDGVEVAVDAEVADVRDLVERLEELQHPAPDRLGAYLGPVDLVLETVGELAQDLVGDRPLVRRAIGSASCRESVWV